MKMKRSEALDIIDDDVYEHDLPLLQGISKEILGRLEKAGMSPPDYDDTVFGWNEGLIMPPKWEDEDETK
jgi:hypothetical protein